jgi:hypothetical protein
VQAADGAGECPRDRPGAPGSVPGSAGNSPGGAAPRRRVAWRAFVGRLLLAHFIAYPIGFVAAIAAMPLAFLFREEAILGAGNQGATSQLVKDATRGMALSATEAAQLQIVLEFVLWVSLAALLAVHLAAVPWGIGAARAARQPEQAATVQRRGYRTFVVATATTTVLVVLAGAGGWLWLFLL